MKVLLSIRPKYVEEIFSGKKIYEFRKKIFKKPEIKEVYVYATSPVCKIVGKFVIETIYGDSPENLWQKFEKWAGMSSDEFFKYFQGKETGYAIKIKNKALFDSPIEPKRILPNFVPPQSFYYLQALKIDLN